MILTEKWQVYASLNLIAYTCSQVAKNAIVDIRTGPKWDTCSPSSITHHQVQRVHGHYLLHFQEFLVWVGCSGTRWLCDSTPHLYPFSAPLETWSSEHKCDLSLSAITIPFKYIISLYSHKSNLKCCISASITKYFALQSFTHLHPKEQPFRASLELQHIHASCSALVHPLELTVIREYYQILKHKIKTLIIHIKQHRLHANSKQPSHPPRFQRSCPSSRSGWASRLSAGCKRSLCACPGSLCCPSGSFYRLWTQPGIYWMSCGSQRPDWGTALQMTSLLLERQYKRFKTQFQALSEFT